MASGSSQEKPPCDGIKTTKATIPADTSPEPPRSNLDLVEPLIDRSERSLQEPANYSEQDAALKQVKIAENYHKKCTWQRTYKTSKIGWNTSSWPTRNSKYPHRSSPCSRFRHYDFRWPSFQYHVAVRWRWREVSSPVWSMGYFANTSSQQNGQSFVHCCNPQSPFGDNT